MRTAFPPAIARWSSCRPSSIPRRGSSRCSTISKCGSSRNRDPHLHFALLTDFRRRRRAAAARRRRAHRRRAAADRRAQRALRCGSVLLLPSRAPMEPGRGPVDGMGAQARQAGGVQPAAARRDRHELRRPARRYVDPAVGPLRHHARLGHAAAAGSRRASWSARSRTRSTGRASIAGAAASPKATACCSRASASASSAPTGRCSRGCSPGTSASIRTRPRSRTSIRTCSTRAATSARGSTTSMPSRPRSPDRVPENTLLSHDLFEGFYARAGLVHRHRARRRLPRTLPRLRRAPASLGARRLADCPLAVAHRARRRPAGPSPTRCRSFRAGRFSTTCGEACMPPALVLLLAAGWTILPGSPALWTTLVVTGARVSGIHPARRARSAAAYPACRFANTCARKRDAIVDEPAAGGLLPPSSWRTRAPSCSTRSAVRLWRMLVSRRRLLEWVSADRADNGLVSVWAVARRMWPAPAIAIVVAAHRRDARSWPPAAGAVRS